MHHPSNASLVQAPLQRIEQPFIPTPTYLCEIRAGKQRPDWLSLHLQSSLPLQPYRVYSIRPARALVPPGRP
jgi:hypothetical protein